MSKLKFYLLHCCVQRVSGQRCNQKLNKLTFSKDPGKISFDGVELSGFQGIAKSVAVKKGKEKLECPDNGGTLDQEHES